MCKFLDFKYKSHVFESVYLSFFTFSRFFYAKLVSFILILKYITILIVEINHSPYFY